MSDPSKPVTPEQESALAAALREVLARDDGVASKQSKERKLPEEEPAYRWLQYPAPFCDHFTAQPFRKAGVVRLSFGEYVGKPTSANILEKTFPEMVEQERFVRRMRRRWKQLCDDFKTPI